jgi:hypothetical protein
MKSGIIYHGPSLYDGAPIVVIGTFTKSNSKTGGVVQTYILRDDIDPRDASKGGQDVSICGSCPHRGEVNDDPARKIAKGRTCYVNLGQGVLITWLALQRGVYPDAQDVASRAAIGAGRVVRVGTYGDPAACRRRSGPTYCATRQAGQPIPILAGGVLTSRCKAQTTITMPCYIGKLDVALSAWSQMWRTSIKQTRSYVQRPRKPARAPLARLAGYVVARLPNHQNQSQSPCTRGLRPKPKSRGTRIGRPAPRSAALARVPEPRTVDPDPTTPTKASRPDPTGPDPDNLGPTRPDPRIVVPNQLT